MPGSSIHSVPGVPVVDCCSRYDFFIICRLYQKYSATCVSGLQVHTILECTKWLIIRLTRNSRIYIMYVIELSEHFQLPMGQVSCDFYLSA